MAGYSGTPLAKKLGIKAGHRVALVNAPKGFESSLAPVPADVRITHSANRGRFDIIVLFSKDKSELTKRFPTLSKRLDSVGALWAAWPKKASGVKTDLSEGLVREIGLRTGLVDVKVCAIDETWSGLRFVIRLKDRAASTTGR